MEAALKELVIHYEIEGREGAPVVTLSHSLACSLRLWDQQMPALGDRFRVLRFDTRGHGASSAPPGPYDLEMLTADLIGLLDRLGIARTHFVGISMGGMIGQVLACRYPHLLDRLVLASTTCRVPPETAPLWEERIRAAQNGGMEALAPDTLKRWLSDEFRRDHPQWSEKIRRMILDTPVDGYIGCSRAIGAFDISGELGIVVAPTLVVAGSRDESTPVSAAMAIRERIEGARLALMPGALHLCNIEACEAFNRTIPDFLGS